MKQPNKKNILHICSWYPNRVTGLSGNFIHKHIRSVNDQTNSLGICVVKDKALKKTYEINFSEEENVRVVLVFFRGSNFFLTSLFRRMKAYLKGYRIARKKMDTIDLIHAHVILDGAFIAYLLSFWLKCSFVITEHSTDYIQASKNTWLRFLLPLVRFTTSRATYIFPVSFNLKKNMINKGIKAPYEVIGNVVDQQLFKLKTKKTEQLRFLHISTFHWHKNTEGILDACKILSKSRKDFVITIAGDGNLEKVKAYSKKINLDSSLVAFCGKMSEVQVADIMQKHDCFVLFSHFENLPCVLVEAQMCGLPIVATDVGGVKEIVDESKLGVIIPPADQNALVKAMNDMINNYTSFDPKYIRNRAIDRYAESTIGQQLVRLYDEC